MNISLFIAIEALIWSIVFALAHISKPPEGASETDRAVHMFLNVCINIACITSILNCLIIAVLIRVNFLHM